MSQCLLSCCCCDDSDRDAGAQSPVSCSPARAAPHSATASSFPRCTVDLVSGCQQRQSGRGRGPSNTSRYPGHGALRLHIHTQQQLLYLIDFLNVLNFLAAISPWHQTSPNSQIKVEIWICKDRYLHQDNSDRQPGHDAICGDIGSVCNANYRCQIIIFITLGRGHYTDSAAAIRQSAPHHCYHSKHAAATDILGIYLLYRPASSP